MKEILQRIRALRSIKGYSYENMAEELNISTSAYRKIEKNETKLTVERLFQIAKVLQAPVNQIIGVYGANGAQQGNTENQASYIYPGFENLHYENRDPMQKRIQLLEDKILLLKDEINLILEMVSARMKNNK